MRDSIENSQDGIAIIGMSGRFPKARNVSQFWENLRDGVECISFFSDEELLAEGLPPALLQDPRYVKAGGCLDQVDLFDARFFGFSPREAEVMDPQHRLFLECAWESLEDAACDPQRYNGLIGVYAGTGMSTYLFNVLAHPELVALVGTFQVLLGNDKDHLTTHVSYKLNLKGPSVVVQSACSTSLVAVCMACQGLLDYHCDIALAGGVSVAIPSKAGYLYSEGAISSPDGHCRAFDATAQGTVAGNGVGIVVLKRLADALKDGDRIRAVIKGTAINNDGSLKVGYTAPSVEGQAEVIAMAQALAEVDPSSIGYVETHGTGTPVGDPVELAALTRVFRACTSGKRFCAIGSVKTNIGHLDSAAGVAGLIKTVLAVEHGLIPPSLHFERANPETDLDNSPFFVNTRLSSWPGGLQPRRAGVSSFGVGGTNAHLILEQAPAVDPPTISSRVQLLIVSAKTESALEVVTANLAEHLGSHPELNLADVAYTLQIGRSALTHRRSVVCGTLAEAAGAFCQREHAGVPTAVTEPGHRPVIFLFPGQGAQYVEMALEIYEAVPFFRAQVDVCAEGLRSHLGFDLRDVLFPDSTRSVQAAELLNRTEITQPALFTIEYALARLWMDWGVVPSAMIGHSIGEYVAATLAHMLSLEEALRLVVSRGRLMQQMPPGAMLSIPLPPDQVEALLRPPVSLAAVNGPSLCVASGPSDAVDALAADLKSRGVECRRLRTSHAFHSAMMDPVVGPFTQVLSGVTLRPPEIPFISNLTGTWIHATEATDPNYWARHLRQPVHFAQGLEAVLEESGAILLETGPGRALSTLARKHPRKLGSQSVLCSMRNAQEQEKDYAFLLNTAGRLWLSGVPLNWPALHRNETRRSVALPTYPFERRRHWVEGPGVPASRPAAAPGGRRPFDDWFYVPAWRAAELPAPSEARLPHRWLVFADACGVGARLASRLDELGHDVTTVIPGAHSACDGPSYVVNPTQPESYRALMERLRETGRLPDRIVHLWSVARDGSESPTTDSFHNWQDFGFYSLLYLGQALNGHTLPKDVHLAIVTSGMQNVTGDEPLRPEKATLLGLRNVLPQEHPNLHCRSIDLNIPGSEETGDEWIERLVRELEIDPSEPEVALRARRWVRTFDVARLAPGKQGVRDGGVYLITGGLGAIGLVLSEHLARTARTTLVLTSRSAFPERGTWDSWLATKDAGDRVCRIIDKVRQLEELGSRIRIVCVDVSDGDAMRNLLRKIDGEFAGLDGVIHAAGVTEARAFPMIQKLSPDVCEEHFRSKALGCLVLENVLAGRPLDFCVLFSSISSVLGGLGYAAYSAANAFLDAFVERRNRTAAMPWISVAWDGWLFGDPAERRAPEFSLSPEEGVEAFRRVRAWRGGSRIVVSTGDLPTRINRWITLAPSSPAQPTSDVVSTAAHARPDVQAEYVAPRDHTEQAIAAIWQALLGIQRVGVYDNFFELGGHSLLAIQLTSRLREAFQVEIPVNRIFEIPTVAALATSIGQVPSPAERSADITKLEEMLQLVEGLSESEVRALLESST